MIRQINAGSPASYFAAGGNGAWFNPQSLTTMFQDEAGTTPVTAVGDPIGRINSIYGTAYASQGTAGNRPVLGLDAEGYYFVDTTGGKSLTANFSPGLNSTSAHVQYAYRGWGAARLAGQTIDTSYSITHPFAGLIITDWPLSATERASFDVWANSLCRMGNALDYAVDYVNGNDSNNGRSPFAPKKTIAALPALSNNNGVGLARGSTWKETFGGAAATATGVRVRGYGAGKLPILDGADTITSGWSKTAGLTNVYQVTVTHENANSLGQLSLWEDGVRLKWVASTALCDAEAGTMYVANLTTNTSSTVYVNTTGSGDPASNGKTYEVSTRLWGLASGNRSLLNWDIRDIHTKRSVHNDGSLSAHGTIKRCLAEDGHKHNMFASAGSLVEDCIAWKHDWAERSNSTLFVAYNDNAAKRNTTFRRCVAVGEPAKSAIASGAGRSISGFYAHTAGGSTDNNHGTFTVEDCSGVGLTQGVGVVNTDTVQITRFAAYDSAQLAGLTPTVAATVYDCFMREASTFSAPDSIRCYSGSTLVEGFRLYRQYNGNPTRGGAIYSDTANTTMLVRRSAMHYGGAGAPSGKFIWSNNATQTVGYSGICLGTNIKDINYINNAATTLTECDNNCFHANSVNTRYKGVSRTTWALWRSDNPTLDVNSVHSVDPQFVDPANGNFTPGNANVPSFAGCARPNITYTAVPSEVTLAAM